MIDTIIFDLGKVLVDFHPEAGMRAMGFSEDAIQVFLDKIFSGVWEECDRYPYEDAEIRALFMDKVPGYEVYVDMLWDNLHPITGVRGYAKEWLASLKKKGLKLYVLSNFGKRAFEINSEIYDFLELMDGGVISYEVEMTKPEPGIYEYLLKKYGIEREHAVFLDDRIENVEAARSLGINAILFENYETARLELNEILSN